MTENDGQLQRISWRIGVGIGAKIAALGLLYLKSIDIPYSWTIRSFGSFMGREADFLGSAIFTILVIFVAGFLLSIGRWLSRRWGLLAWLCLAVASAHLVQDSVLAWAVYKSEDTADSTQRFQRNQTLPLRGTTFFDGAGMEGPYIIDMVGMLEEVGVKNVRAADRRKWSGGALLDSIDVFDKRRRDDTDSDLSAMGTTGEQFNLIGYSYGALQASQAAIDYADNGGKVDHLVLIGAPISKEFLGKLEGHPNIGKIDVIDLNEYGDPIRAGMSTGALLMSVPVLGLDFSFGKYGKINGHFFYGGLPPVGQARRRELARRIFELGIR